jgi:opacity protein-like surface antigen
LKDKLNIDELLHQKLGGLQPEVPQNMWDRLEGTLDKKKRKKRFIWWIAASAMVVGIGSIVTFNSLNNDSITEEQSENKIKENQVIVQDDNSKSTPDVKDYFEDQIDANQESDEQKPEENKDFTDPGNSKSNGNPIVNNTQDKPEMEMPKDNEGNREEITIDDTEKEKEIVADNNEVDKPSDSKEIENDKIAVNENKTEETPIKLEEDEIGEEENNNKETSPTNPNPPVIVSTKNFGLSLSFSPTLLFRDMSIRSGYNKFVHEDFKSTYVSQEKNNMNQSIGLSMNFTPNKSNFTFHGGVSLAFMGAKRSYDYRYKLPVEDGTELDDQGNPEIIGYLNQFSNVEATANNKLTYLEIPLSISYKIAINDKWSIEPKTGFSYMYLLEATGMKINQGRMDLVNIEKNNFRSRNFGLTGTAGIYYQTNSKIKVGFEPYYHYMLRNAQNNDVTVRTRTNGMGLNFGVNYLLF